MATGIRDKVAIVGMGCSRFGERWDCGPDDRVENACATGTEALRGAAYAVAAGAYDIVLALGVEKLKDTGYGGLPARTRGVANDLWLPNASAPGAFAQLASAYAAKHGVAMSDLKRAMADISVKSHANAALNPKAHLRKLITEAVLMEDLGFSAPGRAIHDVLDGVFDRDGALPVQPDGGLKCFGHPIGAPGLRMVYEIYLQLHGRASARQLPRIDRGLTHNLGGHPHQNVCAVSIVGRHGA